MSLTLPGWTSATMATYVVKAVTHVASAPTSLVSGALAGVLCEGSASRRSARAILSGRRSRISTNSSDCIFRTSLPGMGGKLEAKWNGGGAVPA